MIARPTSAMLLAAGLGTRMRPLTETTPKPLLYVRGRTMIDRTIDHLIDVGVTQLVVNLHHLGEQIRAHLSKRKDVDIQFLEERHLLDTGGAVKNALRHLGSGPFYQMNTDQVWTDVAGQPSALARLAELWDGDAMDSLMLVYPRETAFGFDDGQGDFYFDPVWRNEPLLGKLSRRDRPLPRPYVWMSVQITRPEVYRDTPNTPFSNNLIWNRAEVTGRLFGLIHQGGCYQIGRPQDLARINRLPEFKELIPEYKEMSA